MTTNPVFTNVSQAQNPIAFSDIAAVCAAAHDDNGDPMPTDVAGMLINWFYSFGASNLVPVNARSSGGHPGFPPGGQMTNNNPWTYKYQDGIIEVWVDENGTFTVRKGRLASHHRPNQRPGPGQSGGGFGGTVYHGIWADLVNAIIAFMLHVA